MIHDKWKDDTKLALLQQGDAATFWQLYDDYAPVFFSIACRLISKASARDEIVIDLFLDIRQQLPHFVPGDTSLFLWMYALMQKRLLAWHEGQTARP